MRKRRSAQSLATELGLYLERNRISPDEMAARAIVHRATVYRALSSQSRKTVGAGLRRLCEAAAIDLYEDLGDARPGRQENPIEPLCSILAKWWDGSDEHLERLRRVLPLICQVTTVRTGKPSK